jgi:hypothetical protein
MEIYSGYTYGYELKTGHMIQEIEKFLIFARYTS